MPAWILVLVSVFEAFPICLSINGTRGDNYADSGRNLRAKLLSPAVYDHVTRPSATTHVEASLNLLTINELDVKTQRFSCSGWLTLKWNDSRLSWDPSEYGNESYIYALESEIWKPEIIVSNSMRNIRVLSDTNLLLRIRHSGVVIWEPPMIFETHCDVDVTYYPFDSQRCNIELVSWSAPISDQNLGHMHTHVVTEDYRENGEWVFIGSSTDARHLVEHHDTVVHVFSQLEFYVTVRRRPMFYIINTMMPMILTTFLTVLVFLLPTESGEKVSYALTVILALAVLLTVIADHLPSTSLSVPVLAVYTEMTLLFGSFAVFFTVLILRTYHRPPDIKPSAWTMKLTLLACKMIFIKPSSVSQKLSLLQTASQTSNDTNESQGKTLERSVVSEHAHTNNHRQEPIRKDGEPTPAETQPLQLTWIDIAVIWDRFCFHLFTFFCVVTTLVFLLILSIGGYCASHV